MKRVELLLILFLLLSPVLCQAREQAEPDMDLLEYLGSFETAKGKPIDPLAFADTSPKDAKKEASEPGKTESKRGRRPEKLQRKDRDDEN